MNGRNALLALLLAVTAVVLQTTLFVELDPFGAVPNLVLLVVIACVRYLEPEVSVLFGFTAGVVTDLLGDSPLGLWALVMTVVAFITVRLRHRVVDAPYLLWLGVLALTILGEGLFVLVGTLFGQQTLSQSGVVRTVLLAGGYNALLSFVVMPATTLLMRQRRRGWAPL